METITIEGQLELDPLRGVIYFHSNEGETVLRICRLPKPFPKNATLDITHMIGCSWTVKEARA